LQKAWIVINQLLERPIVAANLAEWFHSAAACKRIRRIEAKPCTSRASLPFPVARRFGVNPVK